MLTTLIISWKWSVYMVMVCFYNESMSKRGWARNKTMNYTLILSLYLSLCFFLSLSFSLSLSLSLSIYLSLSISLSLCFSLSVCLSLSIYLSLCFSFSLFLSLTHDHLNFRKSCFWSLFQQKAATGGLHPSD